MSEVYKANCPACINRLSEIKTRKPGEAEFIVKGSVDEKTSKELSKRQAKRFRGWFISCFKTPREERGRSSRWEKKTYQSTKVDQALIELMDYVQEEN